MTLPRWQRLRQSRNQIYSQKVSVGLLDRDKVRIVAGKRVRRARDVRATTVVEFCWVVVWAVGVRAGMNSRLYPRGKLGKEVHVGRAFFAPDAVSVVGLSGPSTISFQEPKQALVRFHGASHRALGLIIESMFVVDVEGVRGPSTLSFQELKHALVRVYDESYCALGFVVDSVVVVDVEDVVWISALVAVGDLNFASDWWCWKSALRFNSIRFLIAVVQVGYARTFPMLRRLSSFVLVEVRWRRGR